MPTTTADNGSLAAGYDRKSSCTVAWGVADRTADAASHLVVVARAEFHGSVVLEVYVLACGAGCDRIGGIVGKVEIPCFYTGDSGDIGDWVRLGRNAGCVALADYGVDEGCFVHEGLSEAHSEKESHEGNSEERH